jgi:PAS domain S-box-containing protein
MPEKYAVLLVEDNFDQALMVQDYLRLEGHYMVEWARDIKQTWNFLSEKTFDIILMDYRLPDGNGVDFLKSYFQLGYEIPVIMVTGEGDEQIAVKTIQLGALDYVVKRGTFYLTLPPIIEKTIREYKLQKSVKESIEKIRYQALLLNNVRDSVVVWDINGRITFSNQVAQKMVGYNLEVDQDVNKVYVDKFIPPIKIEELNHFVNKEVERQIIGTREYPYVSSKITPLFDGDQLIGYMDVLRDISEIKKKEYELTKLTYAIENNAESVIITDGQGKIEYVNPAFEKLTGNSPQSVLGHFLYHMRGQSEIEFDDILHAINKGETHQYEACYQTYDTNQRYDIEELVTPVYSADQKISNIIFTARDITQRKKMQREIEQAKEKISESTRLAAIGELSSGVAHRIYNPLTSIIANAQMLIKTPCSSDEQNEILEDIEKAGWTAQNVVNQLLMFSKPDIGSLEEFCINDSIQNAILLIGGQINAARIQIETSLDEKQPVIFGNQRQLEDLWVNLLLLSKESILEENDRRIMISSTKINANEILVQISDSGVPIPSEHIDYIFEPDFVGYDRSRGSGLELSICREIVRQHNGTIRVESTPERTTFRINIPINHSSEVGLILTNMDS